MPKKFVKPKTPGPSDYKLRPLIGFRDHLNDSLKQRGPQWTIGQRFNSKFSSNSPSPAAYDVKGFTNYGKISTPSYTIYNKTKQPKLERVPGPSYNPTDASLYRWKFEPKYTIANKLKAKKHDLNPGPSMDPFDTNLYKHKQPIYSIREKLKRKKLEKTPGPEQYDVTRAENCIKLNLPSFTHGWKVDESKKQVKTPGPAAYDLRRYNPFANEPSYSIRTKNSEFTAVMIDPRDNC